MNTLARNAIIASLAACGAGPAALADFSYSTFGANPPGVTLVGAAQVNSNRILLTPTAPGSAGAVWSALKQDVATGFDTSFVIHVENKNGGGADGIAFVIQNASPTALGGTGGAMGYARNLVYNQPGISNSFAVAFDMWPNNQNWPEAGDNHVSFQSNGTGENTPDLSASLGNAGINDLSDGSQHTVRVLYAGNVMSVYLDGAQSPVLSRQVNLSSLLNLDNGQAYIGLTAATGALADAQSHVLDAWNMHISNAPAPAAAGLFGLGGLLAARRRRTA